MKNNISSRLTRGYKKKTVRVDVSLVFVRVGETDRQYTKLSCQITGFPASKLQYNFFLRSTKIQTERNVCVRVCV